MTKGVTVFADNILLAEGWARNVAIGVDARGHISDISVNAAFEPELMARLPGPAIPGMPNLHSHAHQRAMAGLSEYRASGAGAEDSFWTWRDVMHRFAEMVTPEILEAVASQLYVEMVKAGYTAVNEFHYVHHGPGGVPYADPAEMSMALIRAATRAGIGITLMPVLYETGGYAGREPNPGQRRFISNPDQLVGIIEAVHAIHAADPQVHIGVAPHSPRQVTPEGMRKVIEGLSALEAHAPIHIHVAEQEKDVSESVEFTGLRPVEWVMENFDVGPRWCLVHATHLTEKEVTQIAGSGAVVGLCPATEANLGDGIFPLLPYLEQGGRFGIGSDSHISISVVEELRWLEYGQRLIKRRRNLAAAGPGESTGMRLYDDALRGGAQASGRRLGKIGLGCRADFVVLDPSHPLLVGRSGDRMIDSMIFSGNSPCIQEVWIAGKRQVVDGRHIRERDTLDVFSKIITALDF
ncbi:formimidoylglutamate deiminase [Thalassospiraceae bacterium LMO-JJ14]|nr:formimidoylglutamate deiminase [Thalassospiraceae bacterium LMO-JJ14]